MDETSTTDLQRRQVAGALALAGVALEPGRDAAIAAQLSATLAACAPLRDGLRFDDVPESVHALQPTDANAGTPPGSDVSCEGGT